MQCFIDLMYRDVIILVYQIFYAFIILRCDQSLASSLMGSQFGGSAFFITYHVHLALEFSFLDVFKPHIKNIVQIYIRKYWTNQSTLNRAFVCFEFLPVFHYFAYQKSFDILSTVFTEPPRSPGYAVYINVRYAVLLDSGVFSQSRLTTVPCW